MKQQREDYFEILISHYSPPLCQLNYQWNLSVEMTLFAYKIYYSFKLLVENSTAFTEPELNQRPKDYCQIFISQYSPLLYQLSYQWNLSYQYVSTERKLLPYKIFYFFKLLAENCTVSTEVDLNQRIKDYWHIFISDYSPPLYQLSDQWNFSYKDASTEIKLLQFKICYFSKLLAENSTASTQLDLNQGHKGYRQILIAHYSPPLYQLNYQWNLSVEMMLLPYQICYFF